MAAQRYLLIVNNIVIRDEQNNPIFEVQEYGRKYYSNGKGDNQLDERVKEATQQILTEESSNPLMDVVVQPKVLTRYNNEFKLKMFITPLYELQMQLAKQSGVVRVAGSSVDVGSIWAQQLPEFFQREFLKYTQLMDYLETTIRKVRHKNSPYTIRHGDKQVMALINVQVTGLFNPMEIALRGYEGTRINELIYNNEAVEITSLDDPFIFKTNVMKGTVPCYFATSSDILKLCGIEEKLVIKSSDLYRLLSGILIRELYAPDFGGGSQFQGVLYFPIEQVLYEVFDDDGQPVEYFEQAVDASRFSMANEYGMRTIDPIKDYITTTFNKNKLPQEQIDRLEDQIRRAYFV